jgi:hypothetical protein
MSRSIPVLAQEAIDIQDACNLLGLSKGFAKAMQELKDELERLKQYTGTDQINTHPITVLWTNKLSNLSEGSTLSDFGLAYHTCCELALQKDTPNDPGR